MATALELEHTVSETSWSTESPSPLRMRNAPKSFLFPSLAQQRAKDTLLQPLLFPEEPKQDLSCFLGPAKDAPLPCVVCDASFSDSRAKDELLYHLLTVHKIVVNKVTEIASMKCYAEYWKSRFKQAPITDFAPVIRTNTRSEDPSEDYYLLSDALPEDRELRTELQRRRLEAILEVQHQERMDKNFSRVCVFCSQVFTGNRAVLFQHMLEIHGFNVGQPDNLVFVNELLDLLQRKLANLQCLYCERTFRDRLTLREHMRKKQHKKISPRNGEYDRFYAINYLELGKSWEEVQSEDDRDIINTTQDDEWGDWEEPQPPVHCLFCKTSAINFPTLLHHMKHIHRFDFLSVCQELKLDYYSQVKVVNYVRRQVYCRRCAHCSQQYQSDLELLLHMGFEGHYLLPEDKAKWDQAQYLFPTYENDALLCALEDDLSGEGSDQKTT